MGTGFHCTTLLPCVVSPLPCVVPLLPCGVPLLPCAPAWAQDFLVPPEWLPTVHRCPLDRASLATQGVHSASKGPNYDFGLTTGLCIRPQASSMQLAPPKKNCNLKNCPKKKTPRLGSLGRSWGPKKSRWGSPSPGMVCFPPASGLYGPRWARFSSDRSGPKTGGKQPKMTGKGTRMLRS